MFAGLHDEVADDVGNRSFEASLALTLSFSKPV
jgi:hypothetical protein